jgi:hypothetical protein
MGTLERRYTMASRIDIREYRERYLSVVETDLLDSRETIMHFTPQLMSDALRAELNRADPETWTMEIPDDFAQAVCEAEERMIETIEHSCDLGTGHGAVVGYGPESKKVCKGPWETI